MIKLHRITATKSGYFTNELWVNPKSISCFSSELIVFSNGRSVECSTMKIKGTGNDTFLLEESPEEIVKLLSE